MPLWLIGFGRTAGRILAATVAIPLWLCAVAFVAALAINTLHGHSQYKAGLAKGAENERAASAKLQKAETKAEAQITTKADKAEIKVQKQIEYRTRTLRTKVVEYVPIHTPAGVIGANDLVPRDTVLLLDAAVRGESPEPVSALAGQSYEIASDLRFVQLVDGVVLNLGVGHSVRGQLIEAQDWAREQAERDQR